MHFDAGLRERGNAALNIELVARCRPDAGGAHRRVKNGRPFQKDPLFLTCSLFDTLDDLRQHRVATRKDRPVDLDHVIHVQLLYRLIVDRHLYLHIRAIPFIIFISCLYPYCGYNIFYVVITSYIVLSRLSITKNFSIWFEVMLSVKIQENSLSG
ncbi:hypothetical protein SDC9_140629 [bioreactor metagenome]|uniref:Uncharacterized protein n=1 Tax=bioreactor metagenome TaxID=1076179 RepID=A0A645DVX9_9ZZZZ